jgi:hypothetical protein
LPEVLVFFDLLFPNSFRTIVWWREINGDAHDPLPPFTAVDIISKHGIDSIPQAGRDNYSFVAWIRIGMFINNERIFGKLIGASFDIIPALSAQPGLLPLVIRRFSESNGTALIQHY